MLFVILSITLARKDPRNNPTAKHKETLEPALAFNSPSTCSGASEKHKLLAIPLVNAIKTVFKIIFFQLYQINYIKI